MKKFVRSSAKVACAAAIGIASFGNAVAAQGWDAVFASGSVGGTYNIVVTAVVEKLKSDYEGVNIDIIPGGSLSNSIRLGRGEVPLAMITSLTAQQAYEGAGDPRLVEIGPLSDMRGVASIYDQHFQVVARADFEADTFAEVIENKIPVTIVPGGPRGHFGVQATNDLLQTTYGITFDDMEEWGSRVVYAEFADATSMIQDGQVDLFTPLTAAPNSSILDLANSRDIKLLSFNDEEREKMLARGYTNVDLPANTYPGQTEAIPTIGASSAFYARSDTDPALVEAIVDTLIKHVGSLKETHVRLKQDFDPATAHEGMGVPLHEGAQRAYEKAGYLN
ncbi:TAXI family TRAP transporter solute-binding subunit [Pseudooceanicola aestuarii]|uniref:TAXI family TRAP transporter solute-binding subunit n=1 Tax=Pseudooceanicola aestuarii TaxID=2697319 RepID=UPI0013D8535E|nr:TAXI family TRAP transporter solute-binding subunit [Pseudooceanicola aestuarii]